MLSLPERKKIQAALPKNTSNGYKLIQVKLPHLTRNQIGQAFLYDNRYKEEVMKAALEVIEEDKVHTQPLKSLVAAL